MGTEESAGVHTVSFEEEIAELLGRQKSERRRAVDDSPAYRNGYGKERKLTLGCGTSRNMA